MATPLLRTKLQTPPLRRGLVLRSRLIERLEAGMAQGHKLAVMAAPPGSGKTTLALAWLAAHPRPAAWLSLDQSDQDPYRFWAYLIATLQTIDPSIGQSILASLEVSRPSPELMISGLINDLIAAPLFDTWDGPVVLVLDDYHQIENPAIHSSLGYLLDNQPANLFILITSRADPPLSLARRRARLAFTEIRVADLRFTPDEAARYLNETMGLDLREPEIAALTRRTEGWVVGLQLAALSLRDHTDPRQFIHALAGDDRYIGDYLMEEVLHHQPHEVQDFLLKSAILGRMNADLCAAVTGYPDSQQILESLERDNLFLAPLDRRRRWFRYHQLFGDLLHRELHQALDQAGIGELHQRASQWYEANNLPEEAIHHALVTGDSERVADLIEKFAMGMRLERGIATPQSWFQNLPQSVFATRPILAAIYAESLMYLPEMAALTEAQSWLERASVALDARPGLPQAERRQIQGYIAALESILSMHRGDGFDQLEERVEQALSLLSDEGWGRGKRAMLLSNRGIVLLSRGQIGQARAALEEAYAYAHQAGAYFAKIIAIYIQHVIYRHQGDLRQAYEICHRFSRDLPDEAERFPIGGALYISMAAIQVEWNQLAEAERNLERGQAAIPLSGEYGIEANGYVTLARLKLAQGEETQARQALGQIRRIWQGLPQVMGEDYITLVQIRLWRNAPPDPETLAAWKAWADGAAMPVAALSVQPLGEERGLYNRLLCLTTVRLWQVRAGESLDLSALLALLAAQRERAETEGGGEQVVDIAILEAQIWQALGQMKEARSALAHALGHAYPGGYCRSFLDWGEPMRGLLQSFLRHPPGRDHSSADDLKAYAAQLLAAFSPSADAAPPPAIPATGALIEPLNQREVEILRLLAEKRSRQEIAESLILSINTIKWHINNLYGKLGVEKRSHAIAKAVELGIL